MRQQQPANFKIIAAASIANLLINLAAKNTLQVSILNATLLAVTLNFAYTTVKNISKINPLLIFAAALVPLLTFSPGKLIMYLILFAGIVTITFAQRSKRQTLMILASLALFSWAALIANNILTFPFHPDKRSTIFDIPTYSDAIAYHQKDARYVPYRARAILFNESVYAYTAFSGVANILTLKNLQDTLLLANLYPLALGVQLALVKRKGLFNKIALMGIAALLIIAGVSRSPDKFNSLFPLVPFLIYFIVLGFSRINIIFYAILFLASIIIITVPI